MSSVTYNSYLTPDEFGMVHQIPLNARCESCIRPELMWFSRAAEGLDTLIMQALLDQERGICFPFQTYTEAFRSLYGKARPRQNPLPGGQETDSVFIQSDDLGHPFWAVILLVQEFLAHSLTFRKELVNVEKNDKVWPIDVVHRLSYISSIGGHLSIVARYSHNRQVLLHHGVLTAIDVIMSTLDRYLSDGGTWWPQKPSTLDVLPDMVFMTNLARLCMSMWQQLADPGYGWQRYLLTWSTDELVSAHSFNSLPKDKAVEIILAMLQHCKNGIENHGERTANDISYFLALVEELLHSLGIFLHHSEAASRAFQISNGIKVVTNTVRTVQRWVTPELSLAVIGRGLRVSVLATRLLHMIYSTDARARKTMQEWPVWDHLSDLILWASRLPHSASGRSLMRGLNTSLAASYCVPPDEKNNELSGPASTSNPATDWLKTESTSSTDALPPAPKFMHYMDADTLQELRTSKTCIGLVFELLESICTGALQSPSGHKLAFSEPNHSRGSVDEMNNTSSRADRIVLSSLLTCFYSQSDSPQEKHSSMLLWFTLEFLTRLIRAIRSVDIHVRYMEWHKTLLEPVFFPSIASEGEDTSKMNGFALAALDLLAFSAAQPQYTNQDQISVLMHLLVKRSSDQTMINEVLTRIIFAMKYNRENTRKTLQAINYLDIIVPLLEIYTKAPRSGETHMASNILGLLCTLLEFGVRASKSGGLEALSHERTVNLLISLLHEDYFDTTIWGWAINVIMHLFSCAPQRGHSKVQKAMSALLGAFPQAPLTKKRVRLYLSLLQAIDNGMDVAERATIQETFAECEYFAKLAEIMTMKVEIPSQQLELLAQVLQTLANLMVGSVSCKEQFEMDVGYGHLQSLLIDALSGEITQPLVDILLSMVVESTTGAVSPHLKNTDVLLMLLRLIFLSDAWDMQSYVLATTTDLVLASRSNLDKCCTAGLFATLLRLLPDLACVYQQSAWKVMEELIGLVEILGSYSISSEDTCLLFSLLCPDPPPDSKPAYFGRLLQAMQVMADAKGLSIFFSFDGSPSGGLYLPPLANLIGYTGFTFHTWIYLEHPDNAVPFNACLLAIQNDIYHTVECRINNSLELVYVSTSSSGEQSMVVPGLALELGKWYSIAITHSKSRGPWNTIEVNIYVNGQFKYKASCSFPDLGSTTALASVATSLPYSPDDSEATATKLAGQIGAVYFFNEQLPSHVITGIHNLGPAYYLSFNPLDQGPFLLDSDWGLSGKLANCLVANFNAKACTSEKMCPNVAGRHDVSQHTQSAKLVGEYMHTSCLADNIVSLGCLHLLCLLIPRIGDPISIPQVETGVVRWFQIKRPTSESNDSFKGVPSRSHHRTSSNVVASFGPDTSLNMKKTSSLRSSIEFGSPSLNGSQTFNPENKDGKKSSLGVDFIRQSTLSSIGKDNADVSGELEHAVLASTLTARFFALLTDLAKYNQIIRIALQSNDGVGMISALLFELSPGDFGPDTVMAMGALASILLDQSETSNDIQQDGTVISSADSVPNLPPLYGQLLFDFSLWAKMNCATQGALVQQIFTVIKDNKEAYRTVFGVQFFLDVLKTYYRFATEPISSDDEEVVESKKESTSMTTQEIKSLRQSLWSIIRFIIKGGVLKQEMEALCSFLVVCVEPLETIECIDVLHSFVYGAGSESTGVVDQLLEVWNGKPEWLWFLLRSPHDDVRISCLHLISSLLSSSRVISKYKHKLRLEEVGYWGPLEELGRAPFTVEFISAMVSLACEQKCHSRQAISTSDLDIANMDMIGLLLRLLTGSSIQVDQTKTHISPQSLRLHGLHVICQNILSRRDANSVKFLKCKILPTLLHMLVCEDRVSACLQATDLAEIHCITSLVVEILEVVLLSHMQVENKAWRTVEFTLALIDHLEDVSPEHKDCVKYHLLLRLVQSAGALCVPLIPNTSLLSNIVHLGLLIEIFLFHDEDEQKQHINAANGNEDLWREWRLAATIVHLFDTLRISHHNDFSFLTVPAPNTKAQPPPTTSAQTSNPEEHKGSKSHPEGVLGLCIRLSIALCRQNDVVVCSQGAKWLNAVLILKKDGPVTDRIISDHLVAYILWNISDAIQLSLNRRGSENHIHLIPLLIAIVQHYDKQVAAVLGVSSNYIHDSDNTQGIAIQKMFNNILQCNDNEQQLEWVARAQWLSLIKTSLDQGVKERTASRTKGFIRKNNRRHIALKESIDTERRKEAEEQIRSKAAYQKYVTVPMFERLQEELTRCHRKIHRLKERRRRQHFYWASVMQFFHSERGILAQPKTQHWKLSRTEVFGRRRFFMVLNTLFNDHANASLYRDGDVEPSDPEDYLVGESQDKNDINIGVDEFTMGPDILDVTGAEYDGKVLYTTCCDMIASMTVTRGRLEVTEKSLCFYADRGYEEEREGKSQAALRRLIDGAPRDYRWPVNAIREVLLRRYLLRGSALEIFLIDQTNCFLNFPRKDRSSVYEAISRLKPHNAIHSHVMTPSELLRSSGLTFKWQNRLISNFDYLMHLNTIAGRTYNDLNQYPVFPWVLCDYTSRTIDLSNPEVYRDLSKPLGALEPQRMKQFQQRYNEFVDPSGTIERFHYGSHYSTAGGVLFYLLRLEPFTTLHIHLQAGRFDHADRQFHSIPAAWQSVTTAISDVKELIPEFFYLPEFLINDNRYDLGSLQDGEVVDDVILPPWAKTPEDFIRINREALESDYVSDNLHHWIDLIFGYKQRGPAAVEATNVFYYVTYEGAVDLDSIADPIERASLESQINNFGQTPSQLLALPHVARNMAGESTQLVKMASNSSATSALARTASGLVGGRYAIVEPVMDAFADPTTLRAFFFQVGEVTPSADQASGGLAYVAFPPKQRVGRLQVGMAHRIVTVSRAGQLTLHSWLDTPVDGVPFTFESDLSGPHGAGYLDVAYGTMQPITPGVFAVSPEGQYIFSGGHWDNSFKMTQVDHCKVLASVIRHADIVTCVALDSTTGMLLATGSKDRTVMLWRLANPIGSPPYVCMQPVHVLLGHHSQVTTLAVNTELDLVVSGSEEGVVLLHTIGQGRLLRVIRPNPSLGGRVPAPIITVYIAHTIASIVILSGPMTNGSQTVNLYSVNGRHMANREVKDQITCLLTNTKETYLVTGSKSGSLSIWKLY
eukprot:Ihof_evm4s19 gene=Ihof_evmTU4s19